MNKGKKYILGIDVIKDGGKYAITELPDDNGELTTIYFDREKAKKAGEINDKIVKEFMRTAQQGKRQDDGSYLIDETIKVFLKLPKKFDYENVIGMTDNPEIREDFHDIGIQEVQRPRFLISSPEILEKGIIYLSGHMKANEAKLLEDKIKIEDAKNIFGLIDPFVNQFILLPLDNQTEILYQIRQDWQTNSKGDVIIQSDPYLERIERNTKHFTNDKNELNMTDFGITTNHLHQYLAYKYLLLNPKIETLILSGGAGSGKTLLGYMAAIAQTLRFGEKKNIYDQNILIKASLPPTEYYTGFKPGTTAEKIEGDMKTYKKVHRSLILPDALTYESTLIKQQPNKFKSHNIYFPSNRETLTIEESIEFIKGETYDHSFYLIDELEDARSAIAKGIATRQGIGTKLVACGDPGQIYNPDLTEDRNGLVYLAKHYKRLDEAPWFAMMHFTRSGRGRGARSAAEFPNN